MAGVLSPHLSTFSCSNSCMAFSVKVHQKVGNIERTSRVPSSFPNMAAVSASIKWTMGAHRHHLLLRAFPLDSGSMEIWNRSHENGKYFYSGNDAICLAPVLFEFLQIFVGCLLTRRGPNCRMPTLNAEGCFVI